MSPEAAPLPSSFLPLSFGQEDREERPVRKEKAHKLKQKPPAHCRLGLFRQLQRPAGTGKIKSTRRGGSEGLWEEGGGGSKQERPGVGGRGSEILASGKSSYSAGDT